MQVKQVNSFEKWHFCGAGHSIFMSLGINFSEVEWCTLHDARIFQVGWVSRNTNEARNTGHHWWCRCLLQMSRYITTGLPSLVTTCCYNSFFFFVIVTNMYWEMFTKLRAAQFNSFFVNAICRLRVLAELCMWRHRLSSLGEFLPLFVFCSSRPALFKTFFVCLFCFFVLTSSFQVIFFIHSLTLSFFSFFFSLFLCFLESFISLFIYWPKLLHYILTTFYSRIPLKV